MPYNPMLSIITHLSLIIKMDPKYINFQLFVLRSHPAVLLAFCAEVATRGPLLVGLRGPYVVLRSKRGSAIGN